MLIRYADSLNKNPTLQIDKFSQISKKVIFTFKDGTVINAIKWFEYVKNNNGELTGNNIQLLKEFASQSILNYYKQNLEKYNVDFKYQMQEFIEGNMLFEIMERNVWSKAGADSINLFNYYNAHKTSYKWKESVEAIIFNCTNEAIAAETIRALKNNKNWQGIVEKSNSQVQADSGRFEIEQLPAVKMEAENFSPVIKNADGTTAFVKFIKIYEPNEQRNFLEARGLVINDYQNILEQKWVEGLRKKYKIAVNEAVLKSIL